MAKTQKTPKLTTISLDVLDHVTGGRGGGPGSLLKRTQAQANPWASIQASQPAPAAPPSFAGFGSSAKQGQAGTAGTPGAYVHNGKFRPL